MTMLVGDCRTLMPGEGPFDLIIADPPYGDTALAWDRRVEGWLPLAHAALRPTGSLWVFGSLRFFMATAAQFDAAGWLYVQDVIWQKTGGAGFQADRFKRIHELIVHFRRRGTLWRDVYNQVQTTPDAVAKIAHRRRSPAHTGKIGAHLYIKAAGGPRIMRSVILQRNCRGRAIHPTEKPVALIEILIRTSCPPGGLVGDWFAGSGAVGEACRLTGRRYVGCEIDPAMAARAAARIAAVLPFDGGDGP
ncbi:DNA-methyltransferase [Brevundimonas diminuta]|mgnify:FL=1|uniref:DNA-methyltransferase n=1 Tax=Brevundimonas diminuta TaxID=293 RepID=UPI0019BD8153|nr:site-specific DNA-methyltransferase [Brevundimonas diminuta]MBD3817413.1 site-specific DNA-methyltransferase [Brevundimonas diminuta]